MLQIFLRVEQYLLIHNLDLAKVCTLSDGGLRAPKKFDNMNQRNFQQKVMRVTRMLMQCMHIWHQSEISCAEQPALSQACIHTAALPDDSLIVGQQLHH